MFKFLTSCYMYMIIPLDQRCPLTESAQKGNRKFYGQMKNVGKMDERIFTGNWIKTNNKTIMLMNCNILHKRNIRNIRGSHKTSNWHPIINWCMQIDIWIINFVSVRLINVENCCGFKFIFIFIISHFILICELHNFKFHANNILTIVWWTWSPYAIYSSQFVYLILF